MRADQKLSPDDRREMILRALSGENRTYLAQEYGVSRVRLYQLLEAAEKMSEADVNEAAKELEFRRRVLEMVGG
jgi:ATP-dependent RNA circularization protein (DNA/RNA ligase family)